MESVRNLFTGQKFLTEERAKQNQTVLTDESIAKAMAEEKKQSDKAAAAPRLNFVQ